MKIFGLIKTSHFSIVAPKFQGQKGKRIRNKSQNNFFYKCSTSSISHQFSNYQLFPYK